MEDKKIEEELKTLLNSNLDKSTDELRKIFYDKILENNPNFVRNLQAMRLIRGSIIDSSIKIESILNNIITLFDNSSLIKADFARKIGYIKIIIGKVYQDNIKENRGFFKNINKFVKLRNLYAHVPEDSNSKELRFVEEYPYNLYFKGINKKDMKSLNQEFYFLSESIMEYLNIFQEFLRKQRLSQNIKK